MTSALGLTFSCLSRSLHTLISAESSVEALSDDVIALVVDMDQVTGSLNFLLSPSPMTNTIKMAQILSLHKLTMTASLT